MINYNLIYKALKKYTDSGFIEIDTPWWTSEQATYSTIPKEIEVFTIGYDKPNNPDRIKNNLGYLVGSAEQGFVQLMIDGSLKPGELYVSAGPCFRNETNLDDLHLQSFFKIELMAYIGNMIQDKSETEKLIQKMVYIAHNCMSDLCSVNLDIKSVNTEQGIDLELNGIEIGSYGHRTFKNHNWIYGTGLAEPRFSLALNKQIF